MIFFRSILILFFLLLLLESAAFSQIFLTARKMYVASAETQNYTEYLDNVFVEFGRAVQEHPNFEYHNIEALQHDLGHLLLANYPFQIDPVKLLFFKEQNLLDVILFFELQQTDAGITCLLKAHEFPSNIPIARISVSIREPQKSSPSQLLEHLLPILEDIQSKQTSAGYPFPAQEPGIVLLTDDYEHPGFQAALQHFTTMRKRYAPQGDYTSFATKVLFFDPVAEPDTTQAVQTIQRQARASAVFRFSGQGSQTVYLPYSEFQWPALKNEFPLWPPLSHFTTFNANVDSIFIAQWGARVFALQDTSLPSFSLSSNKNLRPVLIKHVQLLENLILHKNSGYRMELRNAYPVLIEQYHRFQNELAWIHANYAALLRDEEQLEAAINQFNYAMQYFKNSGQHFGLLLALLQQAQVHEIVEKVDQAQTLLHDALIYSNVLNDQHATGEIYYRLGSISFANGQLLKAWEYFGFSVDNFFEIGDTLQVVQIYTKMGILMRSSRTLSKSREYLQKSLQLAQTIQQNKETANAHYQLAVTLHDLQSLDESLQHFEHAADWMEILGDTLNLANCEEHIGDILIQQEKLKLAQHGFEAASRYYRQAGFIPGRIRSLVKLGDTYTRLKKWPRAQQSYENAIELAREENSQEWMSIGLYKKGLAHIKQGDYELGQRELELAQQSLSMDPKDIESYMQRLLRELEEELDSLRNSQ